MSEKDWEEFEDTPEEESNDDYTPESEAEFLGIDPDFFDGADEDIFIIDEDDEEEDLVARRIKEKEELEKKIDAGFGAIENFYKKADDKHGLKNKFLNSAIQILEKYTTPEFNRPDIALALGEMYRSMAEHELHRHDRVLNSAQAVQTALQNRDNSLESVKRAIRETVHIEDQGVLLAAIRSEGTDEHNERAVMNDRIEKTKEAVSHTRENRYRASMGRAQEFLEVAAGMKGSAEDNSPLLATYALAQVLRDGTYSHAQNLERAFDLILKAAEAGLPEAKGTLAEMYRNGEGTEVDEAAAKNWEDDYLLDATTPTTSEMMDTRAWSTQSPVDNVAVLNTANLVVETFQNKSFLNEPYSEKLDRYGIFARGLEKHTENNHPKVLYALGFMNYQMFNEATVQEKDASQFQKKSVAYLERAAKMDPRKNEFVVKARQLLAETPFASQMEDKSAAFSLRQEFARSGSLKAQYRLAQMYFHGEGTEVNLEGAKYWVSECLYHQDKSLSALFKEEAETLLTEIETRQAASPNP